MNESVHSLLDGWFTAWIGSVLASQSLQNGLSILHQGPGLGSALLHCRDQAHHPSWGGRGCSNSCDLGKSLASVQFLRRKLRQQYVHLTGLLQGLNLELSVKQLMSEWAPAEHLVQCLALSGWSPQESPVPTLCLPPSLCPNGQEMGWGVLCGQSLIPTESLDTTRHQFIPAFPTLPPHPTLSLLELLV